MRDYSEIEKILNQRPLQIYKIFKEFYGEDNVDIQPITIDKIKLCRAIDLGVNSLGTSKPLKELEDGQYNQFLEAFGGLDLDRTEIPLVATIYVYWDKVKVTNEYDESTIIKDLYAKIPVYARGTLRYGFQMVRSTVNIQEVYSDYSHSHIEGIKPYFQTPCLGNGPIRRTEASLNTVFNEDLWNLYCLELDKYVHTESIAGGPWRRLSSISKNNDFNVRYPTLFSVSYNEFYDNYLENEDWVCDVIEDFCIYLCEHFPINLVYQLNCWKLGENNKSVILKVSKLFAQFVNKKYKNTDEELVSDLLDEHIIVKALMKDDELYIKSSSSNTVALKYEGEVLLTFKDKTITFHVNKTEEDEHIIDHSIYVLSYEIITYLLTMILIYLNKHYGKNNAEEANSLQIISISD